MASKFSGGTFRIQLNGDHSTRVPGEHFGLSVDKSLLGTPGRGHNSRPKCCANRESVPFTLDEAIFEVASEAISKEMFRSEGVVDRIA